MKAKPYQVLLVEDDQLIAKTLKMSLPYKGFEVTVCDSFRKGLEAYRAQAANLDFILLDVNLPDGSGMELCREIRKTNELIPVLILTAQTDEASAVQGLGYGADDYIRKPYGVQELTARMLRLIERKTKTSAQPLVHGPISMHLQKRQAFCNDVTLSLGKREFEILTLLVKKAGDAVTREEILNALGEEGEIYDRTIDSHLSHLRKKLKDASASGVQIVPIYGVGYRLEAK